MIVRDKSKTVQELVPGDEPVYILRASDFSHMALINSASEASEALEVIKETFPRIPFLSNELDRRGEEFDKVRNLMLNWMVNHKEDLTLAGHKVSFPMIQETVHQFAVLQLKNSDECECPACRLRKTLERGEAPSKELMEEFENHAIKKLFGQLRYGNHS